VLACLAVLTPRSKKFVARLRIAACLLALVFVALQTTALTHELRHDLHQHDDASCVLHLYADHVAKTVAAAASAVVFLTQRNVQPRIDIRLVALQRVFNYQVRAPPVFSVRSI